MAARLKASPGRNGRVKGTLRRRQGKFVLAALLEGVEWQLPNNQTLAGLCNAALPNDGWECDIALTVKWHRKETNPKFPWAIQWQLRITGAPRRSVQLASQTGQ